MMTHPPTQVSSTLSTRGSSEGSKSFEGRPRRRAELIAPGILLAFAVWVAFQARALRYWSALGPGPGFFPVWVAALLIGLSIAWACQVWLAGSSRESGHDSAVRESSEREAKTVAVGDQAGARPWRVVGILLGLVVVASVLENLGYQLTLMLFLVVLVKGLDRASWRIAILMAVLAGPGVYHLFSDVLAVQLPLSSLTVLRNIGL